MAKALAWGFTGTRQGLTAAQHAALARQLEVCEGVTWWLHGDCVGADAESHLLAQALGYKIGVFPPTESKWRAFCVADYLHPPQSYGERNRLIVDRCQYLLAAPEGWVELGRSGTWSTVRYARSRGRLLSIIWPDGTIKPITPEE
jgi:hypothetical protein